MSLPEWNPGLRESDFTYTGYLQNPIVQKYHGRYLARSENITSLNTDWKPDRVILIEFDTKEQLDMCFLSEEYQQIAAWRENSVDSTVIIIE